MKREIKFRAWNEGKMVDLLAITPLALDANMNTQLALKGMSGLFLPFGGSIELMQFTGLKDKNGKEIYEGDIVSHSMNDYTIPLSVVSFKDGMFVFSDDEDTTELIESLDYCEVIGNIYENPELIQS